MKNAGLLLAALCLLLLVAPDSFAETITLDFESLRREDASLHIWGPTVSEDGFTLTASHFEPGNPHRFNTVGTGHYLYPDSTAVFQGVSQGDILLTRDGLLPFDLISMDLSVLPSAQPDGITPIFLGAFDVTLYGDRMDGGVVSQTLRLDGVLSLQTFSLDAFSNLRAVRWRQGPGTQSDAADQTHQFDNITLRFDPATPAAVPLPSVVAMGLALVAGMFGVRVGRRTISRHAKRTPDSRLFS